jgi:hypothetical protein
VNRNKEKADKQKKQSGTLPLLLGSFGFVVFMFVCLFYGADMRYKESLVPCGGGFGKRHQARLYARFFGSRKRRE